MVDMKSQLELNIIGNQISDWCKHKDGIIFRSSLCSQERCIRFTTPIMQEIFPDADNMNSIWKSGCFFMYEIYNSADVFKITASISYKGLLSKQKKVCLQLLKSAGVEFEPEKDFYFLKEWDYSSAALNLTKIMTAISSFAEHEIPLFEEELKKWNINHSYRISNSFNEPEVISDVEVKQSSDELLVEGGMKDILTNKYERNRTARKKCIDRYGAICNICGLDFGVVYGQGFAGKIEVHHKIPLYEIKDNYVVNPETDLIPVCPNCHMILHSKPGGFYSVDEVKAMMNKS